MCEELIRHCLLAQPWQHLMRSNSSHHFQLPAQLPANTQVTLATNASEPTVLFISHRQCQVTGSLCCRPPRQQAQPATLMSLCLVPEWRSTLFHVPPNFPLGLISNLYTIGTLGSSRMGVGKIFRGTSSPLILQKNHFLGSKDRSVCLPFLFFIWRLLRMEPRALSVLSKQASKRALSYIFSLCL